MFFQILIFSISLVLTLLFFLYGFNHYFLLVKSHQYKKPILPTLQNRMPNVSIHLPIYNERYVVRRLISACASMAESYGVDKVNIKILDDSNDETVQEIDEIVNEYRVKGINLEVLRRDNRTGFKPGALQIALENTPEDYIAIFDADFIPAQDFLSRTIPYLIIDDTLGIIQTRWTHLNRDSNFLTKAIAIGIDVHFLIEQTGRFSAGFFQNFNGSGGVLRKSAIIQAGGWQSDTLAEDLDLSYRMQVLGFKIVFLKDLFSPAEIPPTVPSYKKQQGRWACGSLRTARKMLPKIVKNPEISFKKKVQAFIHLTGYFLHPMMFMSFLLICVVTLFKVHDVGLSSSNSMSNLAIFNGLSGLPLSIFLKNLGWEILLLAILVCTVAPWITMIVSLRLQQLSILKNLGSLLISFLLGFGMSLYNTIEACKALFTNRIWEFKRTPKYADLVENQDWKQKKYQVALDFTWILELITIIVGMLSISISLLDANYGALVILIPYTAAYLFVFSLTVSQSRKEKVL